MLRVGLTGGIGSGKSTVSAQLTSLGAVVIDADAVAREVVEPGTPALGAIADRFGPEVLTSDGVLDRPALGRLVFGDAAALRDLEAITHPAIWARTSELMAAVPPGRVMVHDMPLLVEKQMAADYHLVVVVGVGEAIRVRRLVDLRGMSEHDARARIAAQASDEQRRAAADVWLDNEGTTEALRAAVLRLWHERIEPFDLNLTHGIRSRLSHPTISAPDPTWPAQAARLLARIRHAVGDVALTLDHIGSSSVMRPTTDEDCKRSIEHGPLRGGLRLRAQRRPADTHRRPLQPAWRGHGRGAGHRPARCDRHRQVGDDRLAHRAGPAADPGHGAEQDPGRPAGQRVPRAAAQQRRRVLRQLLRLLPARGVRPADRHLHREGLLDQRRGRAASAQRHELAADPARRRRRGVGVLHLRPRHPAGVRRPDGPAARRRRGRRDDLLRKFVQMQYTRNDLAFTRGTFRVRGDTVEIIPMYEELAVRIEFFGDEVERIYTLHPLTGEVVREEQEMYVFPASHYVAGPERMERAIAGIERSSSSSSRTSRSRASCWRPSACGCARHTTSR
jgi:dephospho-CoA kinase